MERVNFIGHNIKAHYGLIWQVDDYMIVLYRGMLGGMFLQVIDPKGEKVADWPTTYSMHIVAMQVNYMIDQTLKGDIAWIRKVHPRQGFIAKVPPEVEDSPDLKKIIATQMVEWVNKTFGECLDEYEENFPHVDPNDIDKQELQVVWKLIEQHQIDEYRREHSGKKRLKKIEQETEEPEDIDAEEMYKRATEDIEGDHDEWAQRFGKDE